MHRRLKCCLLALLTCAFGGSPGNARAQEPAAPPVITSFVVTNGQARLAFTPYPAAEEYRVLSKTDAGTPLEPHLSGLLRGFGWEGPATNDLELLRLETRPMDSNAFLTGLVLNRLAYGPTPDELDRLLTGPEPVGPQRFIEEQLAPWDIADDAEVAEPLIEELGMAMAAPEDVVTDFHLGLDEFEAWHTLRAVNSRAQLLEIMLQFCENHFVTRHEKSRAFLFEFYRDSACTFCVLMDRLATQWEYLENRRWRAALLNPQCTFHDLLRVSAESPAMIVYLDTVLNGAEGTVANENYARELLELFGWGVDNGYDQSDIEAMAPAWMGWSVDKVASEDATNVFARPLAETGPAPRDSTGVWSFVYKENLHHQTNSKTLFPGKVVPERFGPPWAGQSYQLALPERAGRDGLQDGYDVLRHVADQPFAMEHTSVKLCRLFVHDNFPNPSSRPGTPGYEFYDYTRTNLSAEAQLVHDCMVAWDNATPKGQIWPVLRVIFNSALFNSHQAQQQKIKTPLEFCVSAVRALRTSRDGGHGPSSWTARTDGFGFHFPMVSMGNMLLFDRGAPDGYPEDGRAWISVGALNGRVRFVQSLCLPPGAPGKRVAGLAHQMEPSVVLQHKLTPAQRTDAQAVAAYLVSILYPGFGRANAWTYRELAEQTLNDGSIDSPPSTTPFNLLPFSTAASSTYDQRVRAAVALLLSLPPFHEQ